MSTPLYLTLAAVFAVAVSVTACKREDKPVSPKPKTHAEDGMARVGFPRDPATLTGAGGGIHAIRSESAK